MSVKLIAIPAVVSPEGTVALSEPVRLAGPASAMVTIACEPGEHDGTADPAVCCEEALADWNQPEEDKAWAYLPEVI